MLFKWSSVISSVWNVSCTLYPTNFLLLFCNSQSVKVVIGALIPSFITMHNSFNSDKLPTNDFICLVIFLGVCLVLQYRPAHAWNTIGQIGGICTLITFIAITILCCVKAGGAGPWVQHTSSSSSMTMTTEHQHSGYTYLLISSDLHPGYLTNLIAL